MRLIGPELRAIDLRRAANRLHWEVDQAISQEDTYAIEKALFDLAQAVASVARIVERIDGHLVEGHPARESFAGLLRFYHSYNRVPR